MAKDPAFLFYSQDWLVGTATMSHEDRGKYITILAQMHQEGRMDEETIRFLVGSISVKLKSKFRIDEKGLWYNQRLEEEAEKRANFTKSRRNNGLKGGRPKKSKPKSKPNQNLMVNHMVNHMDNHMEDENVNEDESINEIEVYPTFDDFWNLYDKKTDSKTKCNSKWKKLNQKTKEQIINHVPLYVASTPDKKFRKNPSTYLNNEGWTHEIINSNEKGFVKSLHEQFKDDPYYKSI